MIFGFSRAIQPTQFSFTPGKYNYGTLYLSLLRVASDVTTTYTGAPKVTKGDGFSWTNPAATDWDWVSRCHTAGRLLSTLAGAGTALVGFLALRRSLGLLGATVSGVVLAVAPAFVVHSRFQTVDVLAVFFLSLSTLYALRLLENPENGTKAACLCGVFAGLSAGTKYTGILAILSLFAALAIAKRPKWAAEAAAGFGAAILAFVVSTPGVLLDRENFMRDFIFEMKHTSGGHELAFAGTPSGFIYHFQNLLIGIGPALVLISLAALIYATYRKYPWVLVLLAFAIPYYLMIGRAEVKFIRYTFPLYITVAAGVGYAVAACHRKQGFWRFGVAVSMLAIGGIPFGGGLITASQFSIAMSSEDPRDAAVRYLRQQPSATIGFVRDPWFWSIPTFPDVAAPPSSVQAKLAEMSANSLPPVDFVLSPEGGPTYFDKQLISDRKPGRIVMTSFQVDAPYRLKGRTEIAGAGKPMADAAISFLDALPTEYASERMFGMEGIRVEDLQYVSPVVYVWKRKDLK